MTMDSPAWTVVREVSMENYEKVVRYVRRTVTVVAFGIFVIVMVIYLEWLKRSKEITAEADARAARRFAHSA